MQGLLPNEAIRSTIEIVTAALGSGALKLLGPADTIGGAVGESKTRAEADAAYLNTLIESVATKLTRGG